MTTAPQTRVFADTIWARLLALLIAIARRIRDRLAAATRRGARLVDQRDRRVGAGVRGASGQSEGVQRGGQRQRGPVGVREAEQQQRRAAEWQAG